MTTVRIERRGRLAVLRMDKARGNAIDEPMIEDLEQACRQLDTDDSVRGVLLASAHPKLFCPGLDLIGLLEYDLPAMTRFIDKFARSIWSLYCLSKPLVAAVGGHAIAGGCVLALTADWRILRRGGMNIGLNEIRIGVSLPWSVAVLLRSSIRPERSAEVALLGRNFADEEAVAAGLAHELASEQGFEEACLARLEEFADKDPAAFATTKAYLRAPVIEEMRQSEARLAGEFLRAWFSEATRARIRATVESLAKPK